MPRPARSLLQRRLDRLAHMVKRDAPQSVLAYECYMVACAYHGGKLRLAGFTVGEWVRLRCGWAWNRIVLAVHSLGRGRWHFYNDTGDCWCCERVELERRGQC